MTTAAWDDWFGRLDSAADALERQLADGALLDFPDLPPPPLGPECPGLPRELLGRATRVLNRLERLERIATAQRHHNALACTKRRQSGGHAIREAFREGIHAALHRHEHPLHEWFMWRHAARHGVHALEDHTM